MTSSEGSHRVYMTFFLRQGCNIQFLEADLRTHSHADSPSQHRTRFWNSPGMVRRQEPLRLWSTKSKMGGVGATWLNE